MLTLRADLDTRAVRELRKQVRQMRKIVLDPIRKNLQIVTRRAKANARAEGFRRHHKKKPLTSYIFFNLYKNKVGGIAKLRYIALWQAAGTKKRKTRDGYNRGSVKKHNFFLRAAQTIDENEVARQVADTLEKALKK